MSESNASNEPCFVVEAFNSESAYKGVKKFDCGDKVINDYVKSNLKRDGDRDNKNIHVLLNHERGDELVGFVSVHMSMMGKEDVPPGQFIHSLPKVVAVVKISMIAVTNEYQKDGWGAELLYVALEHAWKVAEVANDVKGVILDAKESVVGFYERHRFTQVDKVTDENGTCLMFLSIKDVRALHETRIQMEQKGSEAS